MRRHDNEMNLQPDKAPEARNTTWAGEHGEHLRSFQSPEELFLLTLPFIERGNQKSPGTQVTGNRELIRFPLDGLKSGKLPLYVRC